MATLQWYYNVEKMANHRQQERLIPEENNTTTWKKVKQNITVIQRAHGHSNNGTTIVCLCVKQRKSYTMGIELLIMHVS
jgi:hypothetical protein